MKTLVYIQDLGGAKFLLPALNFLQKDTFSLIVDSLSESYVSAYSNHNFNIFDHSETDSKVFWENILEKYDSVISTTSSKFINITNCHLIEIAKNKNILCLGFLDHWKGFDRFYNDSFQSVYLPDWLGVIDDLTVKRLNKENLIPKTIRAVGHPWLDFLFSSTNNRERQVNTNKILIVSQPDLQNDFNSIFCQPHLSDQIEKIMNIMQNKGYNFFYRPHPKEKGSCFSNLPRDNKSYMDMFTGYDIFIGYDSMLLLEASALGKRTVRIKPKEIQHESDHAMPLFFGDFLEDLDRIDNSFLLDHRDELNVNFPFRNSIDRTLLFINEFRAYAYGQQNT